MAKFKLKKPRKPSRYTDSGRKSDSVFLKQLKNYESRLKVYNSKKAAFVKSQNSKPKNKAKAEIEKIQSRLRG